MTEQVLFRQPKYPDEHGSVHQYYDFMGALTHVKQILMSQYNRYYVENYFLLGVLEFQLRTGAEEVGAYAEEKSERLEGLRSSMNIYSARVPNFKQAIEELDKAVELFSK